MRISFFNSLFELAKQDKSIVIATADMGFNLLERFRDELPSQYVNCGIAEANTVTMSAGMALLGKKVFAYSIVPFMTFRCFEQTRVDVCYQDADVKLIGVGGGLDYAQSGTSHHSIEDISVMRSLPNMSVVCPGDPLEAAALPEILVKMGRPAYVRLGRGKEPVVHKQKPPMAVGKGIGVFNASAKADIVVFSTGNMLHNALQAVEALHSHGLKIKLFSMPWIKPIDAPLIISEAKGCGLVVTVEEHIKTGGLRSAVIEVLSEERINTPVNSISLPDAFQKVTGSQEYLRKLNGLDVDSIIKTIQSTEK